MDVMVSGGSCVLHLLNNAHKTQMVTNKIQKSSNHPRAESTTKVDKKGTSQGRAQYNAIQKIRLTCCSSGGGIQRMPKAGVGAPLDLQDERSKGGHPLQLGRGKCSLLRVGGF